MASDWPLFTGACYSEVVVKTGHSGLPRGHNKNDKIQKKSYFYQIQSILTLWQKIDFLFFIYF
jgi:hypothetical protein